MKPAGQNEPGKRNTIRRLIETARLEFAEKGLAGVRMEELAREAGITKQLIYHYYGSKEGLFVAVPVSYTHLDVYKRQASTTRCSRTSTCWSWACSTHRRAPRTRL